MDVPVNRFKRAIREGKPQIGLWLALGDSISAELCADAPYAGTRILHGRNQACRLVGGFNHRDQQSLRAYFQYLFDDVSVADPDAHDRVAFVWRDRLQLRSGFANRWARVPHQARANRTRRTHKVRRKLNRRGRATGRSAVCLRVWRV